MHSFFKIIQEQPELAATCRMDIMNLPEAWAPSKAIRAIVIGADPTNDGVPGKKGMIVFKYVFGIGHKNENVFWGAQKRNLAAIGLMMQEVYVQNICRNYFKEQTTKNKDWYRVAEIWLPLLKEELQSIPETVPILATTETIMKLLVPDVPPAYEIYKWGKNYRFYADKLGREVMPFYRHPKYSMTKSVYPCRQYLIGRLKKK